MDYDKYKTHFYLWIIILCTFIGILIGLFYMDNFKKNFILDELRDNLVDKKLPILDEKNIIGKWESDYDIDSYHSYLNSNYKYVKNQTDCKYYSLIWALYLEKHHIEYKFVTTDNHIFVLAYDDKGLCKLDLNEVQCWGNMTI